jgi:hypothetical protein
MTIKHLGGVFGRNPTFYNVTIEGQLTFEGNLDINSDITWEDNKKALFGDSGDLQIYHDGTNSYIDDTSTGNLVLRGNPAVSIQKYTGEVSGVFNADGAVNLYYDNSLKLATTSTGINVSDNLLIGKTSPGINIEGFEAASAGYIAVVRDGGIAGYFQRKTSDGELLNFRKDNTTVGSVSVTASSTAYNTSSDYRLKENVEAMTGATARLKQLAPKRFNFIADADTTVDGFLAHEVSSVVPEAITGTHNEVDNNGNPVYQGIDQSKLVPLLVATIQELEARITALESN